MGQGACYNLNHQHQIKSAQVQFWLSGIRLSTVQMPNAVWSANKGQNVPSIHLLFVCAVIISYPLTIPKRLILSNISIKMCPHFLIPMNTNRANNIKSTICWNSPDQDAFLKCQQFSDSQTAFCNSNPFNNRERKAYHYEIFDAIAKLSHLVFWSSQSQIRHIGEIHSYIMLEDPWEVVFLPLQQKNHEDMKSTKPSQGRVWGLILSTQQILLV